MKPIQTLAAALVIFTIAGCKNGKSDKAFEMAEAPVKTESMQFKEPPKNDEMAYSDLRTNGNSISLADSTVTVEYVANNTAVMANDSKSTFANNLEIKPPKQTAPPQPGTIAKKLIKTGNLSMKVEDYKAVRQKINNLIPKFNGYIGGENETNDGNRQEGTITIRVPYNQFDGLLDAIAGEGEYIANKTVNVDDVTSEYVDLAARLKTKLEVEERYRDILKKASKIPDILSVEDELRVIREEIEAAQGRMKYINDQTAYSTLTVQMYEILPYQATPQAGFFSTLAEAFVSGWRGLLAFVVGIAGIWPFLVFLAAAIILGRKFLRAKKLV